MRSLAVRPNGRELALGLGDGSVRLFDFESGRESGSLRGASGNVHSVAYSPDGQKLAAVDETGGVWLWSSPRGPGQQLEQGTSRSTGFAQLVWSADGRSVLVAGAAGDGAVRVYDVGSGASRTLPFLSSASGPLAVLPDGKVVTVGAAGYAPLPREASTGTPVWSAPAMLLDPLVLYAHGGWISLDTGELSEPRPSHLRTAIEQHGRKGMASADGELFCLVDEKGGLEMWAPKRDELLQRVQLDAQSPAVGAYAAGCVVPGSNTTGGTVQLYDRTGRRLALANDSNYYDLQTEECFVARPGRVAVFDREGKEAASYPTEGVVVDAIRTSNALVLGYFNGAVEVRPLAAEEAGTARMMRDAPSGQVNAFALGPANSLVAGYSSGAVVVWDMASGAKLLDAKIAGPVWPLLVRGTRVYGVTAIGEHVMLDLAEFLEPRCELMRQVWADVPFTWSEGRAVPTPAPSEGPCASP